MILLEQKNKIINEIDLFEKEIKDNLHFLGLKFYHDYISYEKNNRDELIYFMYIHTDDIFDYTKSDYTYLLKIEAEKHLDNPEAAFYSHIIECLDYYMQNDSLFSINIVSSWCFDINNFSDELLKKIDMCYFKEKLNRELDYKEVVKSVKI